MSTVTTNLNTQEGSTLETQVTAADTTSSGSSTSSSTSSGQITSGQTSGLPLSENSEVDVVAEGLVNGSVLVYRSATSKWTSTINLNAQNMDAGEF